MFRDFVPPLEATCTTPHLTTEHSHIKVYGGRRQILPLPHHHHNMDLLRTVRKEGSRGGLNNFNWEEVSTSAHRQNYLLHSIKAPVGRGQKNKDFSWYAKAEDADLTVEERAEKERVKRQEEMRKVKEAEEDAMAKALGLPVPDRTNANLQPLGMDKSKQSELNQVLKEALGRDVVEEMRGGGELGRPPLDAERRRRHRSRDREQRHRHRRHHHHRSQSRSMEKDSRRYRSRSRDRPRTDDHDMVRSGDRKRDEHRERRHRSRSRDRQGDDDRVIKRRSHRDTSRGGERDARRQRTRSRSRSPNQRHQR